MFSRENTDMDWLVGDIMSFGKMIIIHYGISSHANMCVITYSGSPEIGLGYLRRSESCFDVRNHSTRLYSPSCYQNVKGMIPAETTSMINIFIDSMPVHAAALPVRLAGKAPWSRVEVGTRKSLDAEWNDVIARLFHP